MRPVHVHTAGFWPTHDNVHSLIQRETTRWRAETESLIRNMNSNPLIGIVTGLLFSADEVEYGMVNS